MKREQFDFFLHSDAPEADEVKKAVNEMMEEYGGFITRLAEAAEATDTRKPGFRENTLEYTVGIEQIARFAVWRALVNRERQEGENNG